jgi:signal transduction histidine kinase
VLRKALHWSLLAAAIILWLLALWGVRNQEHGRQPAHIASVIAADLCNRQQKLGEIEKHRDDIVHWIHDSDRTSFGDWLAERPYFLFAFQRDSLIAWSTTSVSLSAGLEQQGKLYHLSNGTYYGNSLPKRWLPDSVTLCVLFPIKRQYTIANEYLQPQFAASAAIDPHVAVADTPVAGAAALHAPDGHIIGWVHPPPPGDLPEPPADWIVWCWLLSMVLFVAWLHRWIALFAGRSGFAWGAMCVVVVSLGIRAALIVFRLPFRISETDLFSPRLYASSNWLPSLGDLLLHVLAVLWILLFIIPRLRYTISVKPALPRWLIAVLSGIGLFGLGALFILLIRSLVLDSVIPLDREHLSSLHRSSIAGLLTAVLLMSMLLIVIRALRNMLKALLRGVHWQLIALTVSGLIFWIIFRQSSLAPLYGIAALWLSIDILGQQLTPVRENGGLFRVGNIFWSMTHCLLLTLLIQHFSREREAEVRKHFAEHIATRHDDAMEYNFGQSLTQIRTDPVLQSFMRHPTQAKRRILEEWLAAQYFNKVLSAYQAEVYLYNPDGKPLLNRDTTSLETWLHTTTLSIPSRTASDLYYREVATDDHIYLALMGIEDTLGNPLGIMGIDIEQKKIVSETVLPELLQPATINHAEKAAGYSYAIYAGGRLVAQTSDYPFPFYIMHDTARVAYHERKGRDASTLVYTPDAYRSVSVWRRFNTSSERLTLFSYLLLLRFLLLAIGAAYRQGSRFVDHPGEALRQLRGIGLRRRLQLYIMGIVALSFVGIGIVTIVFLRQQYDNTGKVQRQAMMQIVARSIQQWMKEHNSDNNISQWQAASATPDFRYFLSGLAGTQKIDINLFDAAGRLTNTTQQAIYDQNLLAPIMRFDVLQDFANNPRALIMQIERIGRLRYQSCYVPLRSESGDVAGYLNVPLFYAQRELDEQISSVVVTLVNLYAVALLLSAMLAYFITRWVTRAFDLIIRQFGRLNLHQNELLQWPYDDEVGVLVQEYNKMVRKVEESVALLARNEREGAFREMARQVAHEIKNPLTPMSLYVQRLQQAIASGEPDTIQLARRVSDALLEQINNLSVIATEFGEFARIGSARPGEVDLSEVVRNVVAPFAADGTIQITYEGPDIAIPVMADRSQLVRIITNLMKNATQAIPDDREGVIRVRLTRDGAEAVLRVVDNGTGISPEAQERLFTLYFTTKTSGTGLGLAMSRQMVEAWGGSIRYETQPGKGTTFTIRLPMLKEVNE